MSNDVEAYRNKYYIIENKKYFYELTPEMLDENIKSSRYFIRAFRYLEKHSDIAGKTFVVVELGTEELPVYGPDVIVIVVSDSFQKIPVFAGKVGMIFKCLGLTPRVNMAPAFSYLYFLMVLRYFRSRVQHRASKQKALEVATGPLCPTYPIPLGDRDLADLDIVPINAREHDVSFLGSITTNKRNLLSPTGLLGTPKIQSRSKMFAMLQAYKAKFSNRHVTLSQTSFSGGSDDATMVFSKLLNQTKICLVPRGDVPETYRFYQGLRYGCVMIIEELPDSWFFNEAPAYKIRNWSKLPALMEKILSDPALLEKKSAESLKYWNDVVSPEALGRYMISKI